MGRQFLSGDFVTSDLDIMSNQVHVETIINASPEEVRSVVLDFASYSKWQTRFPSGITLPEGKTGLDLEPDDTISATFTRPDGKTSSIDATILINTPDELRWRGNAGPFGGFAADHYWKFEPFRDDDGGTDGKKNQVGEKRSKTKLLHGEVYIGWARFLFREGWAPWKMATGMFSEYSLELKSRVEELYSGKT